MEKQTGMLKREILTHLFNQIGGFYIISGFKCQVRSLLMNREHQSNTFEIMKTDALLIELKVEEKRKASTNDHGSSSIVSSQVHAVKRENTTDQTEEVEAIKRKWKPGNRNTQSGTKGPPCCRAGRPGHIIDKYLANQRMTTTKPVEQTDPTTRNHQR
jgi:hypothetical protein